MKTINTVLPIYDKLSKQCYERAKHAGVDYPVPVVCPLRQLPSWQYNVEAVTVGAVTKIELINREAVATDITTYFPVLSDDVTVGTDTYYKYDGDTLNYSLPAGLYYLRITHDEGYIFYSDWILIDCVYTCLSNSWISTTYDTFISDGTDITSAIQSTPGTEYAYTEQFFPENGETVTVIFNLTVNSGQVPGLYWNDSSGVNQLETLTSGLNTFTFTAPAGITWARIFIYNDENSNWELEGFCIYRNYSDKYLKFAFEHTCDLGPITYDDGFTQVLYLETETMEPTFPYTEKGQENGYGQFVPVFQRQDKVYLIRTMLIPQHIVDVLHRLKLHDTITLTDLVGDEWTVKEIDTEHDWQFDDKYYAIATITVNLDEGIVITGCCSAINECE